MGPLGRALYNSGRRFRVQRDEIVPAFARLGGDLTGCRVLEVGGGRGAGAELAIGHLGAAWVDLVDLDASMTTLASARLAGRPAAVIRGDSTVLPLATASYDAAVDFGGIHLADDWRAILAEIARVLRARGRFFFEQPTNPFWTRGLHVPRGGSIPGGFGRAELLDAMADVGLEVIGTERRAFAGLDLLGVARRRT